MSGNGVSNGVPFQRNPPGQIYGNGGIVETITGNELAGRNMKITLTPGPSIPNTNVGTSIPFGTGVRINDSIGTSLLQFDSIGNNLNNIGPTTLTILYTATLFVPLSAVTVTWQAILNQNTTGATFASETEIQPVDSNAHTVSITGICIIPPGLGVRLQVGQLSATGPIIPSSCQCYITIIGSTGP